MANHTLREERVRQGQRRRQQKFFVEIWEIRRKVREVKLPPFVADKRHTGSQHFSLLRQTFGKGRDQLVKKGRIPRNKTLRLDISQNTRQNPHRVGKDFGHVTEGRLHNLFFLERDA